MTDTLKTLEQRMEAASRAMDFEEAKRCRDMISLIRGGATAAEAQEVVAGLVRQQPGAMGLGSSQQRVLPPPGWRPPAKPDLMTTSRTTRGKSRGK